MSHHRHKRPKDDLRTSKLAVGTVFVLLLNLFQWLTLRGVDVLIVSLLSTILGLLGWWLGFKARRAVKKYRGVLQGEGAAEIGYWGNFAMFVLSLLFFCWNLFMALFSGSLLI